MPAHAPSLRRSRPLLLALGLSALACSGSEKDDPPPVIDTPEPEDTFVVDTDAPPEEDTPQPVDRDTGAEIVINLEGRAEVVPGALFLGHEAQVVRWRHRVTREESLPRCIYAYDTIDWGHDPIRTGQADPLAQRVDACPDCVFAFTVSISNLAEVEELPWEAQDTDPPADHDWQLNCAALRELGVLPDITSVELDDWRGYGFDPSYDGDGNPKTGVMQLWDSVNAVWVPFLYGVTFDAGEIAWSSQVQAFQVAY
jgi:hypothetical protein